MFYQIIKISATSALITSFSLFAGGLDLSEYSTSTSVGTAGNANQTNIRDASTVATNPAAMSFTKNDMLTIGISALDFHSDFEVDTSKSTHDGGGTDNAGGMNAVPGIYYVQKINDYVHWGAGLYSITGLGIKYDNDWAGRYHNQKVLLSSIRFGHSLSYRVSEEFSVGGSIYVDYATWETKVAFDTPGTSDGYLSVEDEDPAVGAMASFMYTPGDTTRIGVTYRSKVVHNFKDKPDTRFSGVSDVIGDIEAEFELPQMVLVGVRQELTPKLAILMSGSWEEWSKFGELQVKTRAGEDDIDRNYDDTYSVGIGLEYQLTDEWLLMCGYKYDSSVQTRSTRTADLPLSSQRRYAVGAEYKYSKKMTIGVAYEYADLGTPKLDQTGNLSGTISGEYDQYIQFFTLSCTYNF